MSIEYHPDARAEFNDAMDYYESQKIGLGIKFLDTINLAAKTILQAPERWPISGRYYRRYLIDRFPYSIYYEIRVDGIFIFAIAHASRKPGYWHSRLPH